MCSAKRQVPLREIAIARSGEKGDCVYLAVVAREETSFDLLRETVTVAAVQAIFEPILTGPVERFELPKLGALNFALHGALDGGRTRNLAFDESGKALASRLLAMPVTVDDAWV